MRIWRLMGVAMFLAAFTSASMTFAGEVLSEANDPGIALNNRLVDLLSQEKASLGGIRSIGLEQFSSLPPLRFEKHKPEGVDFTFAFLDSLPTATGGANWKCLSEALYFEARGESVRGQFAVAEVILNRVDRAEFPDTVCGVVRQGTGRKFQCQFSYYCDGREEVVREPLAFERAGKIARLMLDGTERTLTNGATHFHTKAVNPSWARRFIRTATIGVHQFYVMPGPDIVSR